MAECFIVRRGGQSYQLPVLNDNYPQNASVVAAANASATFSVQISQPGSPAEYTYQWYKNGSAISNATSATVTVTGLTAAASYSIYCNVTNKAGAVTSRVATLTVRDWKPAYTYSGNAQLLDDGNYRWRIKFLSSGTLNFSSLGNTGSIDVFCVGGGGGTSERGEGDSCGGAGGGYTRTSSAVGVSTGTNYTITVGAGAQTGTTGGSTSAFGLTASGGSGVSNHFGYGGNGGSGGGGYDRSGGTNGGNGVTSSGNHAGGTGQGSTTREFGEDTGALYAGGGAGSKGGSGGAGGGAGPKQSAAANTGGGAGGSYNGSHSGGSGIVVIRNHR